MAWYLYTGGGNRRGFRLGDPGVGELLPNVEVTHILVEEGRAVGIEVNYQRG